LAQVFSSGIILPYLGANLTTTPRYCLRQVAMRRATRAVTALAMAYAASSANVVEECSSCDVTAEHVPSLLQASKASTAVASKESNHAQIGVNAWAGKFDLLEKVPVSTETLNLQEVDVGTTGLKLDGVTGSLPQGLRYMKVFPGVDMLVTPLDEYKPQDGHKSGSKQGYGFISMKGGSSTTFKFQFVKADTTQAVSIKKLYFTMANLDTQGALKQEVSMLTSFNNVFLDPACNIHWHRRNGTQPSSFLAKAGGSVAGSLKEERHNSLTWSFLSTSEIVLKLGTPGGAPMEGRNFYFSGLSSLTKKTCMKTAETTDLKLDKITYSNLGGEGPSVGSQRAIRYADVAEVDGKSIDLLVKNTDGYYRAADAEHNGAYNGFGTISVQPGVDANFSFTFVEHNGMKAVPVKDLVLSFHDFDRAPETPLATSVLVRGFKRAYVSTNTKFDMEAVGGSWYSFNHRISDAKFSRHSVPKSPLRLTDEDQARSVSVEFPSASVVNMAIQMDDSADSYPRSLYFSGVSRLAAARETPFVCF